MTELATPAYPVRMTAEPTRRQQPILGSAADRLPGQGLILIPHLIVLYVLGSSLVSRNWSSGFPCCSPAAIRIGRSR